jgi:hypothetical protein
MQALRGEEIWLLLIIDLGTGWGEWSSVTPLPRFTPGERNPGTHCTGGWVGLRAGLDTEDREQPFASAGNITRSCSLQSDTIPMHYNSYVYTQSVYKHIVFRITRPALLTS